MYPKFTSLVFYYSSLYFNIPNLARKTIIPRVIEPAFGIGRIFSAILEHCCFAREFDSQRVVFNFPAVIAPVKVSVFTLQNKDKLKTICEDVCHVLSSQGISYNTDTSGASIGKRYARSDMQGIPYAIVVDFSTVESPTREVTIRERNTMSQVLVPFDDILLVVMKLTNQMASWTQIVEQYPKFTATED